jgi:hypothetical protein
MATLYAKAAGGNWSAAGTWSNVSSAGADNSGPPTSVIDVVFDAGSVGTVTVDTTSCACKTLTCQAAANSITFTNTKLLDIYGNVTFFAGMTLSGTGIMRNGAANILTMAGLTFPGTITSLGSVWTLNGDLNSVVISCASGYGLIFAGAYNIYCESLYFYCSVASQSLTLAAGQTIEVANDLFIATLLPYTVTILSGTPGSPTYLNYLGTAANCKVFSATFTDIDASGSAQPIDNWYGGTLTRTAGIVNRTSADIAQRFSFAG